MGLNRHLLYVFFAVIAGSVIYIVYLNMSEKAPALDKMDQKYQNSNTQHSGKSVVHMYYSVKGKPFLRAEKRVLFHSDDPAEFGKVIIETLIRGPKKGLVRTIPEGTTLHALYVTQDGTACVDMSEAIKEKHPGGIESEIITIYSIVNSLILNIPEIDVVKILIEGNESMTLAGHVDLRFPFEANMLLIR